MGVTEVARGWVAEVHVSETLQAVGALAVGVALAALGGEAFLRGLLDAARTLRVPAALLGTTLAALATSAPELAVSVVAAVQDASDVAIGNAFGSNVANIGLVLAVMLLIRAVPIVHTRPEFVVALLAPLLTVVLVVDGELSRGDGVILLVLFLIWVASTGRRARTHRKAHQGRDDNTYAPPAIVTFLLGGLVALVAAGQLIVYSAETLGEAAGVDAYVIGATVVALGTSTPELATALQAIRHHHAEVGLGTILGSNIINGLLVAPVAVLISPARLPVAETIGTLLVGAVLVLLAYPGRGGMLGRGRGGVLLALYLTTIVLLVS